MNANQKKIIALILSIVAAAFVFNTFKNVRKTASKTSPRKKAALRVSASQADNLKVSRRLLNKSLQPVRELSWARDPFLLPEEEKGSSSTSKQFSQLRLTGIIFSPDNPSGALAIINNEPFKKGDWIMGAQIVDIRDNSIVLSWQGRDIILELWQE